MSRAFRPTTNKISKKQLTKEEERKRRLKELGKIHSQLWIMIGREKRVVVILERQERRMK